MAMWSLSTAQIRVPARACEKVASDLGQAVVFVGNSNFLHHSKLFNHDLTVMAAI